MHMRAHTRTHAHTHTTGPSPDADAHAGIPAAHCRSPPAAAGVDLLRPPVYEYTFIF